MTIKYIIMSLFYRKLIKTDEFKKLISTYVNDLNNVLDKTVDYIDNNKDGYISTGEILYLISAINKKLTKIIKAIK